MSHGFSSFGSGSGSTQDEIDAFNAAKDVAFSPDNTTPGFIETPGGEAATEEAATDLLGKPDLSEAEQSELDSLLDVLGDDFQVDRIIGGRTEVIGDAAADDEALQDARDEIFQKRSPKLVRDELEDALRSGDDERIAKASEDSLGLLALDKSIEDTIEQADRLGRELERQKSAADRAGEELDIQVEDLARDEDLVRAQQEKLESDETRADEALDRQQEALDLDLSLELEKADKALRDISRAGEGAAIELAEDLAAMGVAGAEIEAATKGLDVERADLGLEEAEVAVARAGLAEELAGHAVEQADLDTARAELGEAIAGLTVEQQDLIVAKKALGTRLAQQGVDQAAIDEAQAALGAQLAELTFSRQEIDRNLTRLERARSGTIRKARIAAKVGAIRAAQAANAGAQGGFGASSAIAGLKAQATTEAAVAAGDMLTQLVEFGLKEESLHDEMGVMDARGDVLSASGDVLLTRENLLAAKGLQIEAEDDAIDARVDLLTEKGKTIVAREVGITARDTLLGTKAAVVDAKRTALDKEVTTINARGDLIDAKGNVLLSRGELLEVQEQALADKADLEARGFADTAELLESTKEALLDKRELNSASIEAQREAIKDEFSLLGLQLTDATADIAAELLRNGMDREDLVAAIEEISTRQVELGNDKEEDIQFLIDTFDLGGSIMEAKGAIDRAAAASLKEDQDRASLIGNIAAVGGLVAVAGGGGAVVAGAAVGAAVLTKLGIL